MRLSIHAAWARPGTWGSGDCGTSCRRGARSRTRSHTSRWPPRAAVRQTSMARIARALLGVSACAAPVGLAVGAEDVRDLQAGRPSPEGHAGTVAAR